MKYLHNVFQAIIVTRTLYALSTSGCFLYRELTGRLDAFLKQCYRCGFMSKIEHVDVLFDTVCADLFHKIIWSGHCLHDILPPVICQCYDMRQWAHTCPTPV